MIKKLLLEELLPSLGFFMMCLNKVLNRACIGFRRIIFQDFPKLELELEFSAEIQQLHSYLYL